MLWSLPAVRAAGYFVHAWRRTWRGTVILTFFNPFLYLIAMGVGLGTFVDHAGRTAALGHVSYLDFVAPALAATSAAQVGAGESTYPVMGAVKWHRTYHAMLATPLRVGDVLAGHLLWMAARAAITSVAYVSVMACFGAARSWETIAVVPVAVMTGMAVAAPLSAFSVTQESDGAFALVFRLAIVPLTLFSAVFFPLNQLPQALRVVAYATPLWHGVDLCRALASGRATVGGALVHVGYLLGLALVGIALGRWTYRRRLVL